MEARARRAVAAVGFAAVVVAAIGLLYLRPWVGLIPTSRPAPRPTLPLPVAPVLKEQFLSGSLGWVVTGGPRAASLFRTTDGGRHWQRQLDGLIGGGSSVAWTLSFFDARRGVVAGADAGGPAIWQTADGGRRWTRHDSPCQPVPDLISFADPDHGWCVTRGASFGTIGASPFPERQYVTLYRTVDGGVSWPRVVATDPTRPVSGGLGDDGTKAWIWFSDARTGWIGQHSHGGAAVYATTDGGDHWDRDELPPPPGGWASAAGFVEEGPQAVGARSVPWVMVQTLGAASRQGQFPALSRYLYARQAATWTQPVLVQSNGALSVDGAHWLVATDGSVLESTDAGESWHGLGLVPAGWLVEGVTMVDRNHGWAVLSRTPEVANGLSIANGLARTADGGRTWTLVGLPS